MVHVRVNEVASEACGGFGVSSLEIDVQEAGVSEQEALRGRARSENSEW